MATSKTTNPVPQVLTAHVQPADMLRRVVQVGKAVHTAALDLVYSSAAYILLVSHFQSTNSKSYMSVGKAVEYLEDQLREHTGVQNRMLANYLDPAKRVANGLMNSQKMFAGVLQKLGTAKAPEDMVPIIADFVNANKDRRIESLNGLKEALGYAAPKVAKPKPMTPDSALEQVTNLIARVEDTDKGVVGTGRGKLTESHLASAIIPQLKSKAAFLVEGVKSITEQSELDTIDRAVKEQRKMLSRLSSEAKAALSKPKAKVTAKHKAIANKIKAKGKAVSTQA